MFILSLLTTSANREKRKADVFVRCTENNSDEIIEEEEEKK